MLLAVRRQLSTRSRSNYVWNAGRNPAQKRMSARRDVVLHRGPECGVCQWEGKSFTPMNGNRRPCVFYCGGNKWCKGSFLTKRKISCAI